jgi:hypothetical protein
VTAVAEPLYVRDGSRFVLYDARAQHAPPILVEPRPVTAEGGPTPEEPVVEVRPGRYRVYAARCPHGKFRGCRSRGCPGPR